MLLGTSQCRVKGCRYRATHVTMGHRCGRCGGFGHGLLECGRRDQVAALVRLYGRDVILVRCTARDCPAPQTHSFEAHVCAACDRRGPECACVPSTLLPTTPATTPHAAAEVVRACCPTCRTACAAVDLTRTVFTGAECVVCTETAPAVVFPTCRHATVCAACVRRLADIADP